MSAPSGPRGAEAAAAAAVPSKEAFQPRGREHGFALNSLA